MKNEVIGSCQGIGAVLTGEVVPGCITGPVVRFTKAAPPALVAVAVPAPAPRSGGHVATIVPLMTKPTKQAASKQLMARAAELRAKGIPDPTLTAMLEQPENALIATARSAAAPTSKAARDEAGARLVKLVGEMCAREGITRAACWERVIRQNPELSKIASGR